MRYRVVVGSYRVHWQLFHKRRRRWHVIWRPRVGVSRSQSAPRHQDTTASWHHGMTRRLQHTTGE